MAPPDDMLAEKVTSLPIWTTLLPASDANVRPNKGGAAVKTLT